MIYTRNLPAENYLLDAAGLYVTGCSEKQSPFFKELIAVLKRELDNGQLKRKSEAVALGGCGAGVSGRERVGVYV